MKHLRHDIAKLTFNQWLTLISLLVVLNMVVMGGVVWLIASDVAPEVVLFKQITLAQAPSTSTPYPTFTPVPLSWTVSSGLKPNTTATPTLVPTWTPSITPTPLPTNTPTETPIPPPATRVVARSTATPTPSPTPDVDFLATVRQLTACENQGKHHIFVNVVDENGNGLPGHRIKVHWVGGEAILETGTKREGPGLADFAMFKGQYFVEMLGPSSTVAGPITPDIPQNEECAENGNAEANSLFHYSYEVVFKKAR